MKKNIALVSVLVVVVLAIVYLEGLKAGPTTPSGPTKSVSIALPSPTVQPSETSTVPIASSGTQPAAPSVSLASIRAEDAKNGYPPAVELVDPTGFVNTPPFKLADLVGKKVILLDFWTYSCINCIRTLPYLTAWYAKYHDQGLEIVGVHTPEFEFEKDIANVQAATQKFGILYPVVLDSNYGTWQAYNNLYWPHEYLIDIAGNIVHDHIGEGDYDATEAEIQKLLAQRAEALGLGPMPEATGTTAIAPADLSGVGSPETYFGAARNQYLANGVQSTQGTQSLTLPSSTTLNQLYLDGNWNFVQEYATNVAGGAKILYKYHSAKVFLVASAPAGVTVEVLQDGKPIGSAAGSDVVDGKVTVKESRLYSLASNPDGAGDHTLELIIDGPGLQAYTFTFG